MQATPTSYLTTPILAFSLGLCGCRATEFDDNSLVIREPTTSPNDLARTLRVGTSYRVSGVKVDAVGEDTIVTSLRSGRARRFILTGMSGYRGRIRLDSVDLVVGDVSLWIDEASIKVSGPHGSVDLPRLDDAGTDVFA